MGLNHTSAQSATAPDSDKLSILIQSPVLLGATALLAGLISVVSFLAHKPAVHYKSPPFLGENEKDTLPILGANGFVFRPW